MELITLTDENLYEAAEKAASVLRRGGVVLFPTDTLYGLAADAGNAQAIERIRRIKAREAKKPISIVVPGPEALHEYAHMDEVSQALADRHLPGALTLVVPAKETVHASILLNDAIGVRVPNHPFTNALSKLFGRAFTATSANLSRHLTPDNVPGILEQLRDKLSHVDLVVDAGTLSSKEPSTVVLVRDGTYYVIREGAIRKEDLLRD